MNNLITATNRIPEMTQIAIDKVCDIEEMALTMPQVDLATSHLIHGGMYARTMMIPANVMITGALIKIATVLIVHGDVTVYIGDEPLELHGYNVIPASTNRKQAFVTQSDSWLTMIFPSSAENITDAEIEFTDDAERLISRKSVNYVTITGE